MREKVRLGPAHSKELIHSLVESYCRFVHATTFIVKGKSDTP